RSSELRGGGFGESRFSCALVCDCPDAGNHYALRLRSRDAGHSPRLATHVERSGFEPLRGTLKRWSPEGADRLASGASWGVAGGCGTVRTNAGEFGTRKARGGHEPRAAVFGGAGFERPYDRTDACVRRPCSE